MKGKKKKLICTAIAVFSSQLAAYVLTKPLPPEGVTAPELETLSDSPLVLNSALTSYL